LERFAVVGISGGGPYALACAWKMTDRIVAAGVVSSLAPADRVRRELSYGYQLTALAVCRTRLLNLALGFLDLCARRRPELIIKGMGLAAPLEDKKFCPNQKFNLPKLMALWRLFAGGHKEPLLN
jgi:poly(3-hydroxybutyrate) depolymerase